MSLPTDIAQVKQVSAPEAIAVANDVASTVGERESTKPQKDDSLKEQLAKRDAAINQPVGAAWKDVRTSLSHLFTNVRHHAIDATPRFFVNNSSNLLGAAHVATEVLMTKSSIPHKALVENPTGPIDYVTRALKRVFSEAAVGSKSDIGEMLQAMKGKPIRGFIEHVRNTDAATERAVGTIKERVFNKKEVLQRLAKEMPEPSKSEPLRHILNAKMDHISKTMPDLTTQQALHRSRREVLDDFAKKGMELSKEDYAQKRVDLKLGNPWQTRSTLAGLIVWSLSALIPDKRESAEEVERMAVKRETNPLGYIGERLKQAVWIPEWPSHKRQMIGVGIMSSGICSMIGAWRNNVKEPAVLNNKLEKVLKYKFNGGYFATSMLTFISSLPLLFAADDQKGFGGFGAWMTGRLAFLPGSIAKKMQGDKLQATYYTGAMASFQAENWAQALIGGAEKLPDGTIVDHEEIKRRAHVEAAKIRADRKSMAKHVNSDATPSTLVSNVSHEKMAMPERVEQTQSALA